MSPKLTFLLALLALAPSCLAHTYFKADQVPFGDQAPDAPESAAVLELYTHAGEVFWTLNITGGEDAASAKLVFGNPDVDSEDVVTYLTLDGPGPANATSFEGVFNATSFSAEGPYATWTVDTLAANAGLGHVWAVVASDADYNNVLLAGPLTNFTPAGEAR